MQLSEDVWAAHAKLSKTALEFLDFVDLHSSTLVTGASTRSSSSTRSAHPIRCSAAKARRLVLFTGPASLILSDKRK